MHTSLFLVDKINSYLYTITRVLSNFNPDTTAGLVQTMVLHAPIYYSLYISTSVKNENNKYGIWHQ